MKFHLIVLALCIFLAPTIAQDAAPPVISAKRAAKSVTLDGGLVVTPLDVAPDIVVKMMSIEMWRFKVSAPNKDQNFKATLELRRPDATPQFLSRVEGPMPKEVEYIFGFMPVEGDNFFESENWRTYNEMRVLENFPTQDLSDPGLATVSPNPLFDLNAPNYSFHSPVTVNKDGSMVLMTFRRDFDRTQPPVAELVLIFALAPKPTE